MNKRKMSAVAHVGACLVVAGVGFSPLSGWAQVQPAEPTLDVAKYRIEGDTLLSEADFAALVAPYVGEKRSLQDIEQAARAVEKALHERGFVFHRVFVPAQKPVEGVLVLNVIRFNLEGITVTGNAHFSTANVRRSLPALKPGTSPDMAQLGSDLTAANANPAKQMAVTFREGKKPETVDAEVRVKDADPLNFFAGYTANRSVDPWDQGGNLYRMTVGVQHSNLFDLDHVGTLSYTTDPRDLGKVTLLGAFYQIPFYGTGLNLAAYYTHSDVSSGRVQQGSGFFDVSGKGDFLGVRITKALPRLGTAQQTVSVAVDERYFENSTTFAGTQIQPNVGSRPLSGKYTLHQDESWGGFGGNIEYARNLGGGAANRGANYKALAADYQWDAFRYGADVSLNNWGWDFAGRLRGQWSSHALIPGEQFGLGGANSVRGFSDREVAGDQGVLWNIEAKAPQVLVPQMRPVLFVDGGEAYSKASRHREALMSAGAGLRWNSERLETSLDLAHVLDRNGTNPDHVRNRLHFSVFYRF